MTDITTAVLLIGPNGVGPFNSPDWRVDLKASAQLVEGSGNGPYWLYFDPTGQERALMIDSLDPKIVADSIQFISAVLAQDAKSLSMLEATHNVTVQEDGTFRLAPYWELADSVVDYIADSLRDKVRLGLVVLDETSIVNEAVSAHLLERGFRVNAFISAVSVA